MHVFVKSEFVRTGNSDFTDKGLVISSRVTFNPKICHCANRFSVGDHWVVGLPLEPRDGGVFSATQPAPVVTAVIVVRHQASVSRPAWSGGGRAVSKSPCARDYLF